MRTLRPARALGTGLIVTALVAGCSSASKDAASTSAAPSSAATSASATSSTSSTATPTPTKKPAPSPLASLSPELRTVMTALYGGGKVPAAPTAAAAIGKRTPKAPAAKAKVVAKTGVWKKTPVAVVKVDGDVTLLTKEASGWQVAGGWWPSLKVAPQMGGKRFVAMLGVDARPGEDPAHTRADSLHILGYDGKDGAGLLGMARDTWVTLPSGRRSKINGAMVEGGPQGMVGALRTQVGVPVQDWIVIDFEEFIAMINKLGGVGVTLPYAVNMETSGWLRAGYQKLSGLQALALARTRHTLATGDFQRSRHQGLILLGGALTAKTGGPTGLPHMMSVIGPYVVTSLTASEALTFFALPYVLDIGKIGNKVSAGSFGTSSDGQSIVLAGGAEQALYADFRDGNLTP